MSRLYVGNFSFEQQLGERKRVNLPRHLLSLNADYASVWLSMAQDGDIIYAPHASTYDLQELADDLDLTGIKFINELNELKSKPCSELVPWGWNEEIAEIARIYFPQLKIPDLETIKQVNSRHTSFTLEQELNCSHPEIKELQLEPEISQEISRLMENYEQVVLKAEYGMSGRERIICNAAELSVQQVHWIRHRLEQGQRIYLEPWLHKVFEVSSHYEIQETGLHKFLGMTPLLTNERGEHIGNITGVDLLNSSLDLIDEIDSLVEECIERLSRIGYRGPVSIDSMVFQHGRKWKIRPIQDINARWSMGRIALEFGKRLAPHEISLWHHFRQDQPKVDLANLEDQMTALLALMGINKKLDVREIHSTSPENFGKEPVRFQTELMIFNG